MDTEEDVKIKLVAKFLCALGFQEDELHFERSFHLKLGRYTYHVETAEQRQSAAPRLDILVTRNGTNLFVIEVKNDRQPIGVAEIEQATSYARLVHPVAPFAIVTNGKETRIYDAITRQEITPTTFTIKDRYDVVLTDDSRYEALKSFIGYSKANITAFCRKQVCEHMKTLLGSKSEPHKKYVPELYTSREELDATVQSFITSSKAVLGIYGDAGIGKTCAICATALALLNDCHPVLFYRARDLVQGLAPAIAADFNWEFSSEYSEIGVLKRVTEIFGKEHLSICIDAVDEWILPGKVEVLGNFLRQTSERHVKVILTCKTCVWSAFLQQSGVPTEIAEAAYPHHKGLGYRLQAMNDKEFHFALRKYSHFYGFTGRFEDRVLDECKRNPFFLRVIFAGAHKLALNTLTLSCIDLFHDYYVQTRNKLAQPAIADAALKAIAQCLLEKDRESLELDVIRQSLQLPITQDLPAELFEHNILESTHDQCSNRISFYFGLLREYIIAFHVLRLQEIELSEYTGIVERFRDNQVFNQAIGLFYPTAPTEKQEVIDQPLRRNATAYLDLYTEILAALFPNLRASFAPGTNGAIGFYGELSIQARELTFHGFRAIKDGKERVQLVPVAAPAPMKWSNLSYLYGATGLQWTSSAGGFRNIDIKKEVLAHDIVPQLKTIIHHGLLNESNNRHLLLEKVIAIVAGHYARHFNIRDVHKMTTCLPMSFDKIEYAMRYERAVRVFKDELVEHMRQTGIIKETWQGSQVSYSYQLRKEDLALIHTKAEQAAKNKVQVKSKTIYVQEEKVERALVEAISALKRMGVDGIVEPILPDADSQRPTQWTWDHYAVPTGQKLIKRLYHLYLDEYRQLVATNFSAIAASFSLYVAMPLKCIMVFDDNASRCRAHVYMPAHK